MTIVAFTKSNKYCGEGGNPQRVFIADAKKGLSDLKADASKHLIVGQTQLDFIKSLGSQMDVQARRVLENYVATCISSIPSTSTWCQLLRVKYSEHPREPTTRL